jgi:putative redox protein
MKTTLFRLKDLEDLMKVYLKQLKGITTVAKATSNHWVVMDGGEQFGGSKAATSPMELLLMSLAGCTSADVISIIDKMRLGYTKFEAIVTAERAEEHPKVYTKIHIDYYIFGENIKEESFKRAIELSQDKYCSISAMLNKTVAMTYAYHINKEIPKE